MCRSKAHGSGRRCPGCGSYKAAAKANANRRLGREARKKVVDHLKEQGMALTAAAVQAAPPSVLPELMAALGIDASVLGDTPMPSTHAHPPSAKLLIAHAETERATLTAPTITPAQTALDEAEERVTAADADAEDARKAVNRLRARLRKAKKAVENGAGSPSEVAAKQKDLDDAKQAHLDAKRRQVEAWEDLAAAKFGMRDDMTTDAERDVYYASLSDDEVDTITRALNRRSAAAAAQALTEGGQPALASTPRDTGVYTAGTIAMETGSGVTDVEGRILDGGTAIYRRGPSDFIILQRNGDAYHPVAQAHGKNDALAKANRIPVLTAPDPLPTDATDLQKQAHAMKGDVALVVARRAVDGYAVTPAAQQATIDEEMAEARDTLTNALGGGPARADIHDGIKRHRRVLREKAAAEAGEQARATALAVGATTAEADAAYAKAHRRALGTQTVGGGTIPHFDHDIPPQSLGADNHASLWRSGIRAYGKETADDYPVIAQRAGDLKDWGFTTGPGGHVQTSNIGALTTSNTEFVQKMLSHQERSALTTYTGGSYRSINAAITGRDANPSGHIKTVVSQLDSAFDKFRGHNPNTQPMTLVRGTQVPSGWKGSTEEYIDAAFTVGSRMQIGKVTSFSTNHGAAHNFAGHPPYMMVVRTRDGLPVKSISSYSSEDEVVLPMGTHLRCVKVDHHGISGRPTVYMVAEDLVAEADDGTGGSATKAA
ncbi:ADP-ribosyltransferase [Rhodococcus jostii]|uniref:ADP-ribosyltransferase n=1 Tax=Rhodococcus jostii TaxID=132919 RepID=A0ABU4CM80_RHOJO|nr:ADP-ribosyltransferase [Rhodococcus jostii]MDV6284568.1 ADP-ribosyltransferase [Rhodococcus jostii]